jgi:FAD:protein FMN transferase
MVKTITRRTALRVVGAGISLPLSVMALRSMTNHIPQPARWSGSCLGALSQITLWHNNKSVAERAIGQLVIEIERLEKVFSLYRYDSEISILNRTGKINSASVDLINVLQHGQNVANISGGAFDPTIQSLWKSYADQISTHKDSNFKFDRKKINAALTKVDYTAISIGYKSVKFEKPEMLVSLNGIAQGYITDAIAEVLGNLGFENAVIDLGETRTLGTKPDGFPFTIGLIDPVSPTNINNEVNLSNSALSVSGGYGMILGNAETHHIFDPKTGLSANKLKQVAVIAPKAIDADALSTAIYVAGEANAPMLLAAYPKSRAILTRNNGTTKEL